MSRGRRLSDCIPMKFFNIVPHSPRVDKIVTLALHQYDNPQWEGQLLSWQSSWSLAGDTEPKRGDIALAIDSKVDTLPKGEACDVKTPSLDCAPQPMAILKSAFRPLRGEQQARLAALLSLCDPSPQPSLRMLTLSAKEWEKLLKWLRISGLALYFLNRVVELDLCDLLPPSVFTRLHQNLIDNTQRTRSMIAESIAIQQEFKKESLKYSILKGFSLCPGSVPKPELRSQFDLDFLVAEGCAAEARRILERRGYRLYAISGKTWEFKINERPGVSVKDIYKDFQSYAVELHVESTIPGRASQLERLEWRELHGISMPVLSPVDLLLGQGLHAFKHICGESSRAAHLLEFRRHVLYRQHDGAFWRELQVAARYDPRASVGLGVVTLLITGIMGEFAPRAFTTWTVDSLSRPVRLWVEMYGYQVALGSYPGNKLYLLLQRELHIAGIPEKRPLRRALFPSRLPPPVIRASPNESLTVRIRRYRMHLHLILERLLFHVVEGFRFSLESRRWRRMKELAQ
jgi:putative nucleotidyltransferase-like protein